MSVQDLLALLELAERAHKSQAEILWLAALAKSIREQLAAAEKPDGQPPVD